MLNWPTKPLGKILANFDSRRIPLSGRDRKKRRGPYPYYGAAGVIDYVDQPIFSGLHLLIGEDGSVVRDDGTPFTQLADGEFWVNNHAHVLRGKTESETRYVYYALNAIDARPWVTGAVQPKLNQHNMNQIPIPFPVRSVREQIVEVLSALDEKIELNGQTADRLERLARAIFRTWFVDFEPVKAKSAGADSFSSMPQHVFDALPSRFVDSEIGPVPEWWEVKAFSTICTLVSGGTPKRSDPSYWSGDVPWYSVKDAPREGKTWVINTDETITQDGLAESAARLVPKGCTIISARGTVGKLAMAGMPMAFNQSCYGLWPSDGISFRHLYLLVHTAVAALQQKTHGSVFDTITRTTFDGLIVISPPPNVLSAFEERVAPFFDASFASLQESVKLAELRDYVLPKLLSGQIRVEVADG